MNNLTFTVKENTKISLSVFELTLKTKKLPDFVSGMFANVKIPDSNELLLGRPFCLHSADYSKNTVKISFDLKGKGTTKLASLKSGDKLEILMPLGNGFPAVGRDRKILLVGGGTGVLPLLSVAQTYKNCIIHSFIGFKNKSETIKIEEFTALSHLTVVTTDDGSCGKHGYITDAVHEQFYEIKPDIIFCCGPPSMLLGLKRYANEVPIFVTLESRMGCGIGACLVCSCPTKDKNGEINFKRSCADGPVFEYNEVFYD